MLCFCSSFSLWSQKYYYNYFDKKDGLIQSQIQELIEDEEGYLWISTSGGVAKFDGKNFENFTEENGLLSKSTYSMTLGENNQIWVGTVGAVQCFQNGAWQTFNLPEALAMEPIVALAFFKGQLLAATYEKGVFVLSDGVFKPWLKVAFSDKIIKLKVHQNQLWVLGNKEIAYFLEEDQNWVVLKNLSDFNISDFDWDSHGHLWASTTNNGLICQQDTSVYIHNTDSGLLSNEGLNVLVDRDDRVWMGSKNGVSCWKDQFIYNFGAFNGLKNPDVRAIYQDFQGNIWLGTHGSGLAKFAGFEVLHFDRPSGFFSDLIMSATEDANATLWFGSYDNGIAHLNSNGRWELLNSKNSELQSDRVYSLTFFNEKLWLGTDDGLYQYHPQNETWVRWGRNNGLLSEKVYRVFGNKEGLWVGTLKGLTLFDENGVFITSNNQINNVKDITSKENKTYFLGSEGVLVYHNSNFSFFAKPKELWSATLRSLCFFKGKLLIGTSRGVYELNDTAWDKYQYPSSLGQNDVSFLGAVNGTDLYIGTQNGVLIADFHPLKNKEFKIKHLLTDKLGALEASTNAFFQDSRKRLWMGARGGMTCILNKDEASKDVNPKIYLEKVKLFLNDLPMDKQRKALFRAHQNHLTFQFKSVAFSHAEEITFEYTLKGFDDKWHGPIKENYVTYANLPSGKYQFEVRIKSAIDYPELPSLSYVFEIKSPLYLRWWFLMGSALIIAGILGWWVKWRKKVVEEKLRLGKLESESKLKILEQKSLNASMNRHFIFNALNSIQYYINRQDKLSANKYLAKFARLIRLNLDSTQSNLVSLEKELERLELYLQLEQMRFDHISYAIEVDEALDLSEVEIPALMLQPFVENSIIHGLLPLEGKRAAKIHLSFNKTPLGVQIVIEDNGVGLLKSREGNKGKGDHTSHGMEITNARLELFGAMINKKVSINGPKEMKAKDGEVLGTKVYISIGN